MATTLPEDQLEAQRRRQDRTAAIREFADRFLRGENQDLFEEMLVTVCRLAHDQADRGDVKLLNKALGELRYALKLFAPYSATRKISIFGSSRTPEEHPDYQQAVRFARQIRENGWMVITGAGDGIMKAGHGGAGPEASFGVAIRLPFEQKTNTIIADDAKLVNFRYFFTRKLMFMKEASAVALFPGGFGTQDEGFEALTLIQTGKAPLVPIVMIEQPGGTYWLQWRAYVKSELLRNGMINEQDMHLFRITDDVDIAIRDVVQLLPRVPLDALRRRRAGAAAAAAGEPDYARAHQRRIRPNSRQWPDRAGPDSAGGKRGISRAAADHAAVRPQELRPPTAVHRHDQPGTRGARHTRIAVKTGGCAPPQQNLP